MTAPMAVREDAGAEASACFNEHMGVEFRSDTA